MRPAEQVEQLRQQREKRDAAERARTGFVAEVVSRFDGNSRQEARLAMLKASESASFKKLLTLLEEYAVTGDEYARRGKANSLLDEIVLGTQRQLKGKQSGRAFNLLVELGVLSQYENLWLRRSRLSLNFTDEIEASARVLVSGLTYIDAETLSEEEASKAPMRRDLTWLDVVTIDDASTRDIDDGLSLRRLMDGNWELGVHIADPASIVPLGHPLEVEARRRGTSVYEPTRVLPMFPNVLSEGAMSLVEGKLRPAISFLMTLNRDKECESFEVTLSWIKVTSRMTYDYADRVILNEVMDPLSEMLDGLRTLSEEQLNRRLDRGAVILQIPGTKIVVEGDKEGGTVMTLDRLEVIPTDAVSSPSRDLVQEMMVITGHMTGRYFKEREANVPYRSQPTPIDPEVEEEMKGQVYGLVESFARRRKMKRSEVTMRPTPHFGLGLEVYCQVTSPIRRYTDLLCHYQLHRVLGAIDEPQLDVETVREVLRDLDGLAIEATMVERESKRFWTLVYLSMRLGEEIEALVVDIIDERRTRVQVFLESIALAASMSLLKSVPVGERIQVRIEQVDPRRDLLTLKMIE